MSKDKKDILRFDPGKLEEMQEPLTVRVEKLRGSSRMPIDLPPREEGYAPGIMWDKDAVRRLESWLVNEWAGGGVYRILVVDKANERMEWEAVYDPRNFPERIPPTMNAVLPGSGNPMQSNHQPQQQQPQQQQPSVTIQMPQGHWPPPNSSYQPIQLIGSGNGMGAPTMSQPAGAPMGPMGTWGQPAWGGPSTWAPPPRVSAPAPASSDDAGGDRFDRFRRGRGTTEEEFERKRLEDQARVLQEQVQRLERDRMESEHKADLKVTLERAQQAHAQQMAALQDEMRRITERAQTSVGITPELQQVREEREKLERQREQMERDQRELQRQLAADRAAAELNRRFEDMMTLISKVSEAPKVPAGPDPALLALQEQIRRQEEELRREKERAERDRDRLAAERARELEKIEMERRERDRAEVERREREQVREEIRRKEEETRRLIEELRASQTRGPDPMIEFMKESNRQQIEAMKDLARQQQMASQAMQGFMMPPRDIISMVKDSSNGMDTLQRNVMGIYNDIFQQQRMLVEQAAQLNGGGGDPASVRLLEQGISRAAEFAERYVSAKRDEAVSHAKVQQTTAEAQSKAWGAQQAAAQAQAHAQAVYAAQQAQAAAQQGGGLSGATMPRHAPQPAPAPEQAPAKPKKAKKAKEPTVEFNSTAGPGPEVATEPKQPRTDDGNTDPETGATIAKVIQLRPLGHTDEEWFGAALDEVRKLRAGVNDFIESISMDPPRLDPKTHAPIGIAPEQAVMMVMRAVNYVMHNKIKIKAFSDLFVSEQYADFLDVLLPDAPIQYRADCVEILVEISKQSDEPDVAEPTVEDPAGVDEDEEDDDDGDYNDQDEDA